MPAVFYSNSSIDGESKSTCRLSMPKDYSSICEYYHILPFSVSVEPFAISVRCPKGEKFEFRRGDNAGLDIVMYYTCGGGNRSNQFKSCL